MCFKTDPDHHEHHEHHDENVQHLWDEWSAHGVYSAQRHPHGLNNKSQPPPPPCPFRQIHCIKLWRPVINWHRLFCRPRVACGSGQHRRDNDLGLKLSLPQQKNFLFCVSRCDSLSLLLAGISPETHLLLEHAFCEHDLHDSAAAPHEGTSALLLLLPCLILLLLCRL